MEEFLNKYILLANKTNNIVFTISKHIDTNTTNIINTRCSLDDIDKLVNYVKTREAQDINLEFYDITEYRHDNRVYIKNNTKNEVYIYEEQVVDSIVSDGVYAIRVDINLDSVVPLSITSYDLIVEYESMIVTNQQFSIEIRNYNKEYYTFSILVKKPNSKAYIESYIEELIRAVA
jgi:hypothetical protein